MENTITTYRQTLPAEADAEVRSLHAMCINESEIEHPWYHNLAYLAVGVLFGIVLVKAEIISWFRIQEMFRLKSFHMYGVIGTAVVVGALSVFLIKTLKARTLYGEPITFGNKTFNKGQVIGGLIFGLGWAMTGACPGPLFAQIGTGATVTVVTLASAIAGTWFYGYLRERLPH
ncbi:MAG: YeeE/YedE thiosulfate transporter family protein [Saprospiraceae bacterium]|nr:YeeE/YedE family protein [Saprospiraceae bacterium]MDW8229773.1 YeeE/YedE thiosulfate transporter family protein [Saprospiraceae bacterium]